MTATNDPPQRTSCGACGTTVEGEAPMTWSSQTSVRGLTWLCDRCTRDNLRSIESKLDEQWW